MDRTKTITIGDVCEIICRHCVKAHGRCLYKWDCPLLTEIAKYIDRKTENSSEEPNNCKYLTNPLGDVWECGCCLEIYCEHQIYNRNPYGTLNIVKCGFKPWLPKRCSKRDVVEVVRCKDCINYNIEEGFMCNNWCDITGKNRDENDFCSDGVKKDNE